MKPKRLVTLLVALILSFVLVSAVLAGADSARQRVTEAVSSPVTLDSVQIPEPNLIASANTIEKQRSDSDVQESDEPEAEPSALPPFFADQPGFDFTGGAARLGSSGSADPRPGLNSSSYGVLSNPPMPFDGDFVIDMETDRVWGVQNPGDIVTVTVLGKQMGAAVADGVGFFWTTLYDPDTGSPPHLTVGDTVIIHVNGIQVKSVVLPTITANLDIYSDAVSGNFLINQNFSVTVYVDRPYLTTEFVTTTLDASGNFTADFSAVWDFAPWESVVVAGEQDGVEVHNRFGSAPNCLDVLPAPWSQAEGRTYPNWPVTVTLAYSNGVSKVGDVLTADEEGWWFYSPGDPFEGSDVFWAEFKDGEVISRTIEELTVNLDPVNDRLWGNTVPGTTVRGRTSYLTTDGRKEIQGSTIADGAGAYTIQFGVDLPPDTWGGVFVADAEGDDLTLWNHGAFLAVNQTDDSLWGFGPSPPGESGGRLITVTVDSTDTEFVTTMNWVGNFDINRESHENFPDIQPGEVVTAEAEGYSWQGVVQVGNISTAVDVENDRITGEVDEPTDKVEVNGSQWGWQEVPPLYPVAGDFNTITSANSPFTATLSGFDLRAAVVYEVWHRVEGDMVDFVNSQVDYLRVWPQYNGTLGKINPPDTAFTITLKDSSGTPEAEIYGTSGSFDGNIGWKNFGGTGEQIEPGDKLTVQSAAGLSQTIQVPELGFEYHLDDNTLTGVGPANEKVYVDVLEKARGFLPTQGSGDFIINVSDLQDFYGDGELAWGDNVNLCYADPNGHHICVEQGWPSITALYQEDGGNAVFGYTTIPENTILISITDDASTFVISDTTIAGDCKWCNYDQYWLEFPENSILPDYQVAVDFSHGLTETDHLADYVDVAEVSGTYNIATDIISGTVPPNNVINGFVEREGWQGPRFDELDTGPSGEFSFNFGDEGWDITPGDIFHIYVPGRHNHQTEYVYFVPGINLWLEKENTPGHGMPSFPVLYKIRFGADGNTTAENVIITDTLPISTTYLGDSSGFTVDVDGNVITWTVGKVEPGAYYEFFVSAELDGDFPLDSELESNCARISTPTQGDDSEDNQSCSGGVWVTEGDYGLQIQKWPEPNDPYPEDEFEYILEYGTDGNVMNGPAWITDTLPDDTEVLWWYDEDGWDSLWTEVITTGGQFVLHAPAGIPGGMGSRIHVRLLLGEAVDFGTTLENEVFITTTADMNPWNNYDFDNSAVVGYSRYDLMIQKDLHAQVPVPGGWLNYFIDFRNHGNRPVEVVLTDTLPDGVTYEYAHWGGGQPFENDPFPEPTIIGNQLVWELGELEVNQGKWFHIQTNISDSLDAGDVLTNCIQIEPLDREEDTPDDNNSCFEVTLNEPGPNLSVYKQGQWQNNNQQIDYQLWFANLGDETISDVTLTDTLPISATWQGWRDMNFNFEWDRLTNEDLNNERMIWEFSELQPGENGYIRFQVDLDDPNLRPQTFTNTVDITVPGDERTPADNSYTVVHTLGELGSVDLNVNVNHSNFWGVAQPGANVTVTTMYSETYAFAEWDCDGCWDIEDAGPVWPGEIVTMTADEGLMPVIFTVPIPFTTEADSDLDQVWGQIDHLDNEPVEVDLYGSGGPQVWTDENGNFNAELPDIPRGGAGEVRYHTVVNNAEVTYHNEWRSNDLIIQVNYGHDEVSGSYEEGHTVWITVTESNTNVVKATAQLTTGYLEGWNQPGFSTHWEDWNPEQPDIIPGDWVFAFVEDASAGGMAPQNGMVGKSTELQVGDISGNLSVENDEITGTVDASWLEGTVDIYCHPWGSPEWAPHKEFPGLQPDGEDEYYCDWDPNTEWDIEPGQDLGVEYVQPDANSVYNVFQEATSYLEVRKQGNGNPGEGGNFIFTVQYYNGGEADAENVVITDTLLGPMTYISDTLGIPHTGSGADPIVWNLGIVPPENWITFDVFVAVNGIEGDWITNTVQIDTSSYDSGEPWEKYAEWSAQIQANNTQVYVTKDTNIGDPAAGEPFVWNIGACNGGNTNSSVVTLTDTLPISTTLYGAGWWSDQPGWTEVYRDDEILVLTKPSIEHYYCDNIYIQTLVDGMASLGQEITNTVEIETPNDTSSGDDKASVQINVGEPRTNLHVNKWWNWGQLVPGGIAEYSIDVGNYGNTYQDGIMLTDTLPVSSTLIHLRAYDQNWNDLGEVSYNEPEAGIIVWEVGDLVPGTWKNYQIRIAFDSDVGVGTDVTNQVQVSLLPYEETYDDNYASHSEKIYAHGPNLRVQKWGQWEDRGNSSPRAIYQVTVENIGDEQVMPVVITDTFSSAFYMDGGVDSNYERWWEWGMLPSGNALTLTLESLYGGDRMDFSFGVITDTDPLPEGRAFPNLVEVTIDPDDPETDDNQDTFTLISGPDLAVEKAWIGGDPVPGEQITYAIYFGNILPGQYWWWNLDGNAWISDTLPTGTTFITSTFSGCGWCGITPEEINGNQIKWQFWPWTTGFEGIMHVTVALSDTLEGGELLENIVEIYSDNPSEDLEYNLENNRDVNSEVSVTVPDLQASFDQSETLIPVGAMVYYTDTSTTDVGEIVDWEWDFDDGSPKEYSQDASHAFSLKGDYDVTLVITDTFGYTSTYSAGTQVCLPVSEVTFTITSDDMFVGEIITFTASITPSDASTPIDYSWDFGDGDQENTSSPIITHVFDDGGDYLVTLTVTNACTEGLGCEVAIWIAEVRIYLPMLLR